MMVRRRIPDYQRENARRLRSASTDVERTLWQILRGKRFAGVRFRRQVPIGPYIVDFVSHVARIAVELDGGQHGEADHVMRDAQRDAFICSEGYRVIRIWNIEFIQHPGDVLDRIYLALIEQGLQLQAPSLAASPLPVPPPQGGRGR